MLLTEARGFTAHFVQNRGEIIAKINRALTITTTALQPGKDAVHNPAQPAKHIA
jgi:hypothetical protein